MAKRLCKLGRHDIAENLGDISKLVIAPQFMCDSCARVSSERSMLCKPRSISVQKPIEQDNADTVHHSSPIMSEVDSPAGKKAIKKAEKAAKKLKKREKKLKKVLKKQKKLVRKQQKLERQFLLLNQPQLSVESQTQLSIH